MNWLVHNGALGDIVYSFPTIIKLGGGGLHIRKQNQYDFMKELLLVQPYINYISSGKPCPWEPYYDLSKYREVSKENPNKHLSQCHLDLFNLNFDLSKEWIFNILSKRIKSIVVNVTKRYHDRREINWSILKEYKKDILFLGLEKDLDYFSKVSTFTPEFYKCDNVLEMARIIHGSKLFLGNQSLGFALAEGMKCPRILEVYYKKNNCQPNSNNGYTYLSKDIIERHLNGIS